MKNSILLIAGETAGGKDTLAKILMNHGYTAVCSYATRPMRIGEAEGREHKFCSQEEAKAILQYHANEVAAYTKIGEFEYFTLLEDLEQADMYIIDPNGIAYLKEHFPKINYYTVYVTASYETRLQRAAKRGDMPETVQKRMYAEMDQFQSFQSYDIKFENEGTYFDLEIFAQGLMEKRKTGL